MSEGLRLSPSDRVLEIGTGSGYQAAILAEMVKEVYTVEIRKGLAKRAAERLKELGYRSVWVKYADGYFGWEEHAPFDAIIITAAVNHIPPPLLKQLKEGGEAHPAPRKHGLLPESYPGHKEDGGRSLGGTEGRGHLCSHDRRGPKEMTADRFTSGYLKG
jgi:SAM-dependent methyltransferase